MSNLTPYQSQEELFVFRNLIKSQFTGLSLGLSDIKKDKDIFDGMFVENNFIDIKAMIITLDSIPSVMVSAGKTPTYDFNGKKLQSLAEKNKNVSSIYYTSFHSNGYGFFVFVWLEKDDNVCRQFAQSLKEQRNITSSIISFLFSSCENIFISPDWWDKLDVNKKQALICKANCLFNPLINYKATDIINNDIHYDNWNINNIQFVD